MARLKLFFVFIFILTALLSFSAFAEEDTEPVITADYACVYNVESGEMLYTKSANTTVYPGSLVKIMTAVLSLEHYENNKYSNTEITVTESALEQLKGNNIKLKAGETVSFYDLIAAVTIGGANDAAYVLAETVAGSVDKFVEMMNKKAKELGALNTKFANPTGFHSPMMYSTLSDLAKICEWANKNTSFMTLSSTLTYTMPATNMSKERTFTNSNLLLDPSHWLRHYKKGTSGMNVGMTNEAGYTLATVYNNDGQTNIVIIVGGKVDGWDYHYFNEAVSLIDYTSVSYEYRKLVSRDMPVFDMKVLYGKDTDHVLLATKNEVTALLPNGALDSDITSDYTVVSEEISAPISKGAEMGTYNVYYQGKLVATVPLVAQGSIKRDYFSFISGKIKIFFSLEIVKSVIFLIVSITVFASVIAFIVHYYRKKRRIEQEREERMRRLSRARRTIKQ